MWYVFGVYVGVVCMCGVCVCVCMCVCVYMVCVVYMYSRCVYGMDVYLCVRSMTELYMRVRCFVCSLMHREC